MDDGAKDNETSIKMLTDSFSQGVELCVATSHCILHSNEYIFDFLKRRKESYEGVLKAGEDSEIPKLLLGAEVFLDNDINAYPDIDKLCIEGTNFLLVEFPTGAYRPEMAEWIYEITLKDIVPIIAHVDRYPKRNQIMDDLTGVNIKYQINSSRFLSIRGRRILKDIFKYYRHYIPSSDMHNNFTRRCTMGEAREKANKYFPQLAHELFSENAKRLFKEKDSGIKE